MPCVFVYIHIDLASRLKSALDIECYRLSGFKARAEKPVDYSETRIDSLLAQLNRLMNFIRPESSGYRLEHLTLDALVATNRPNHNSLFNEMASLELCCDLIDNYLKITYWPDREAMTVQKAVLEMMPLHQVRQELFERLQAFRHRFEREVWGNNFLTEDQFDALVDHKEYLTERMQKDKDNLADLIWVQERQVEWEKNRIHSMLQLTEAINKRTEVPKLTE